MYAMSAMVVFFLLDFSHAVMFQCHFVRHVKMIRTYVMHVSMINITCRLQFCVLYVKMLFHIVLSVLLMEPYASNALLDLFSIVNFTVKNVVIL